VRTEFDYIIVGAGLCGLALAKDLSKKNKRVLVLERGNFRDKLGKIIYALFFYDKCALSKSRQGVIIYRAFGVGGTSIVSCGNAIRFTKEEYEKIGIGIETELDEAAQESSARITNLPIGRASSRIMKEANKLGYDMHLMPKFNIAGRCTSCGECIVGCRSGAKWTSREYLKDINKEKTQLVTDFYTNKVMITKGKAIGVEGIAQGLKRQRFFADKIILSAGGVGTPIILQNSGLDAGDNLFVDLFNVTYGISREFNQRKESTMSIVCEKFHKSDGFVLSPFIDNCAGFLSASEYSNILNVFKLNKIMGIMTKIADDNIGKVHSDGRIDKEPTENDKKKLQKGSNIAKEILIKCGVNPKTISITKPRGAHPGGTAAIAKVVDNKLETKIKNLYVCDASVLPFAPGLPPMLSLLALAKWFVKSNLEG